MAQTGDDQYQPKDAIHSGMYQALVMGSGGLLFAAVRTSLAKRNVGPWAVLTRNGGLIATFGMCGPHAPRAAVCLVGASPLL